MDRDLAKDRTAGLDWLQSLRIYFAVITIGNLTWEFLHLPLYMIWTTGSRSEQVFAVAHCTGGDLLIALGSLMISLLLAGDRTWPARSHMPVAFLAIALGVAYTGFSEWLNVSVRRSWAYSEWMPVVPVAGGIGVSPLLQWLVVPGLAFWALKKRMEARSHKGIGTDNYGEEQHAGQPTHGAPWLLPKKRY